MGPVFYFKDKGRYQAHVGRKVTKRHSPQTLTNPRPRTSKNESYPCYRSQQGSWPGCCARSAGCGSRHGGAARVPGPRQGGGRRPPAGDGARMPGQTARLAARRNKSGECSSCGRLDEEKIHKPGWAGQQCRSNLSGVGPGSDGGQLLWGGPGVRGLYPAARGRRENCQHIIFWSTGFYSSSVIIFYLLYLSFILYLLEHRFLLFICYHLLSFIFIFYLISFGAQVSFV